MSSPQNSASGNSSIAENKATQPNALNRGRLSLLGLFGDQDNLRALVRLSNGRIKTVALGSRVERSTVMGIDAKGIVLEKSGRTQRIEMPGS